MSVFEEIILVRIGLDSGTKYYARSDVVGDNYYGGRVIGGEAIGREISVLPRDLRVSDIAIELDNADGAFSKLVMTDTFIQRDLTILMGAVGSGESNYTVRAKGKIYRTRFKQDVFEIRAADELYFQLDEALAGARVNPEYFPDLPEGFEEALVPLVIGDPGIRLPGHSIDGALRYAIAQGRVPEPTAVYFQGESASFTTVRQSYGGAVLTLVDVQASIGTLYGIETTSPDELWVIDRSNPPGSQLIGALTSGLGSPAGLAWDGTDLWCVDSGSPDELWKINRTSPGSSAKQGDLPSGLGNPAGLAWDGTDLWCVDDDGDELWKINRTSPGSSAKQGDLPSGLTRPTGLAWDGTDLWCVDDDGDELWKINRTSPGSSAKQGDLPSGLGTPNGLAWDGTDLWCLDAGGDELWKINRTSPGSSALQGDLPSGIITPISMAWVPDPAESAIEWEGPGITDTELEGGSVITNPVRQIEKLLKLQGFDRDATEITAAAAVAASKGLGGALVFTDAEETLRRALERIAESYNATVLPCRGRRRNRATRSQREQPTIAANLNPTNILSGGLQLANVEEVGSRIDYRYNFDR